VRLHTISKSKRFGCPERSLKKRYHVKIGGLEIGSERLLICLRRIVSLRVGGPAEFHNGKIQSS